MDDLTLNVITGREATEIIGGDTVIAPVPDRFYVDVEGTPALDVRRVGREIRQLAEEQATALGEVLHHATFVLTTDRATVQSHGNMHPGCEECEAGVRKALRQLDEQPSHELLVGQLFWAAS